MKTTSTKLVPVVLFLLTSFAGKAKPLVTGDSAQKPSSPVVVAAKPPQEYKVPVGLTSITEAKKTNYKRWKSLGYSGYIRFYNQYRHMPVRYSGQPAAENLYTVNGLDIVNNAVTGYQEPMFLLRLEGAPTVNTFFKLEYYFDNQLAGILKEPYQNVVGGPAQSGNRRAMIYRLLQFTAGTHTEIGDFTLTAGGGVNWFRLSPMTLWNYEYRDDMFERYPWDPEGSQWGKYNRYYADQNIARDARWGNTGTQGFILQGRNLPKGFGFSALFGKTDNSGGFQSYRSRTPKNMLSGRLERSFGRHKIGANYFSQFGYMNTLGVYRVRQQIATVDGRLNFDKFRMFVEAGFGRFQDSVLAKTVTHGDSTYTNYTASSKHSNYRIPSGGLDWNWAPTVSAEIETSRELTGIPLKLQGYYISKSVVNVNSQVINAANPHALNDPKNIGSPSDITTQPSVLTDVGQMANNRMGGYIRHEDTYGKLKLMAAMQMTREIENLFDTVAFWHKANAFTRSRFAYFQRYLGPYQRITSIFRRTYENIGITDTTSYKKGFSTIDLGLKYKFMVLGRELIVSNFMEYNSIQKGWSLPVFSKKAFIRQFYEEFMLFYGLHPKVTVIGFVSFERNIGNKYTELADANGNKILDAKGRVTQDPNGKPIDQIDHGYGIGLDYDFSGRAGLYIRNRWFDHRDRNFTNDKFRGMESTVELKIFF